MDLITQEGKPIADNDQTETDYIAAASQTNPPAKSKEGLTQQYNTDSDREGTRLDGRSQGEDKSEVLPTKIMPKSAVINLSIIAGFKENNG